jgi:hypothetical protein
MFIIENAFDPIFRNAEGTIIDCTVVFRGHPAMPFTATPDDSAAHGRELYAKLIGGEFGPIAPYVPPPQPNTSNTATS